MAQQVKNLPANSGDTDVIGSIPELGRSPGEGNDNSDQYFSWKIPWTEELSRLQSVRLKRVRHDWALYNMESTSVTLTDILITVREMSRNFESLLYVS